MKTALIVLAALFTGAYLHALKREWNCPTQTVIHQIPMDKPFITAVGNMIQAQDKYTLEKQTFRIKSFDGKTVLLEKVN